MIIEHVHAPVKFPRQRMNEEEFFNFCMANPELHLERDKKGTIFIMAPVFSEGGKFESAAIIELGIWNKQSRMGTVFSSQTGFTLPNKAVRSPDASWISNVRMNTLSASEMKIFAHICPDFVIEICSASDRLNTLKKKMEEYLQNGCRLGFLIDPVEKQAFIYHTEKAVEIFKDFERDTLSGGDVLPGFLLPLNLFKPI